MALPKRYALEASFRAQFGPLALEIDLSLPDQGYTVMLGPSGAGKSLTLKILAGLEPAPGAKIWVKGKDVSTQPPEARGIVYLPQGNSLFPHLSVRDNIVFPFRAQGKPIDQGLLKEVVKIFGLEGLLERRPEKLSGGEAQRVAVARAVCAKPHVLLLDEPLSSLDFHLKLELMAFLKALPMRFGITVLHVTHDPLEALSLAQKIYVLRRGKVVFQGGFAAFLRLLQQDLPGEDEIPRVSHHSIFRAEPFGVHLVETDEEFHHLGLDKGKVFEILERFAYLVGGGKQDTQGRSTL